ncbi:WXG100 family type VII secretion target [Nakamurella sp.]|uniref:WXG100 family type VII secretion target n=1 Tax=Nakamurella sp. TaxID=1869182 RepID=UPI003783597F
MAMFGMDISEVRTLATNLQTASSDITHMISRLNGELAKTTWVGPDRQRFESDWQSHHVTALQQVAQALTDAGMLATNNAQQQEDASNA